MADKDPNEKFISSLGVDIKQTISKANVATEIFRRFPTLAPRPPLPDRLLAEKSSSSSKGKGKLQEWTVAEQRILISAKQREFDTINSGGSVHRKLTNHNTKWASISDYLKAEGVTNPPRDGPSCKKKWHTMSSEWRKVYDYNKSIPEGNKHYYDMSSFERRQLGLPMNFNKELYGDISTWYPSREDMMPSASALMDTAQVDHAAQEEHELPPGQVEETEAGDDIGVEQQDEKPPINVNDELPIPPTAPESVPPAGAFDATPTDTTTPSISRGYKRKSSGFSTREEFSQSTVVEMLARDGERRSGDVRILAASIDRLAESVSVAAHGIVDMAAALRDFVALHHPPPPT